MDVEEIVNGTSFERWLNVTEQPREVCAALANRAAMRALPVAWDWFQVIQNDQLTTLPLLQCCLISAGTYWQKVPTEVATAAAATAVIDAANEYVEASVTVYAIADAAAYAAIANASASAVISAVIYSDAFDIDAYAVLRTDCRRLLNREDLFRAPLWGEIPAEIEAKWRRLSKAIRTEAGRANDETARGGVGALDWTFFVEFYERALRGEAQNDALIEEIVTSDEINWENPAQALDVINAMWRKYSAASLPNVEVVSLNPQTGRLRVDPLPVSAEDHVLEVLAKLDSVLELRAFDEAKQNQYNTLEEELELLRMARNRHGKAPRLLHSVCVRVAGRLDAKCVQQVCPGPQEDANVLDLVSTVRDVISDLVTFEPRVREAVKSKAKVRFELAGESFDAVAQADDEIAARGEDVLAEDMPELARVLRDPNASSAEKAEAWYVSASRILRVSVLATYSGAKATTTEAEWWSERGVKLSANAVKIAGAGAAVSSPMWLETAVQAILRVL